MNKRKRIGLTVLITVVLLLTLTIPGLAKKPKEFTIGFVFNPVDWDHYTGTGEYWGEDYPENIIGTATVSWIPRFETGQGTMVFDHNDGESSVVIRWTIAGFAVDGCGSGHFKILKTAGVYEGMWGNGDIIMCYQVDDEGNYYVDGTLSGWVE